MKISMAIFAAASLTCFAFPVMADTAPLAPQAPVTVPGGPGHFDFMGFDAPMHRVLACHPGSKQLVVLDTKSNQITQIDTGEVNGCGIDEPDNKYFTAGGNQDVVVIDRATLQKVTDIPMPGKCDDVLYEPKNAMVYVDNDDGTLVWVIDPKTDKITTSITIAGAPEVLVYDPNTDKLYQNIKPADEIQVIDPATNTITATWPTAPVTSPHGLAIDPKHGRLFTAGRNGQIAEIDIKTGKVTSTCNIQPKVDEIVFDASAKRIYCACSSGFVSVVKVSKKGLTNVGDVPVATGAHTIAVDPDTQTVWISYADTTNSYLLPLSTSQVASAE